jgi:uridine kinase
MDPRRPLTGFAELADRVRAAPPRLGATRLVCVDGPAGSGKTTFAARLAAALGPGTAVLHMDDVYAGWTLDGAVERLTVGVLAPLADGRPGSYHRYDWAAERFADAATKVAVPEVLVVEGCGSSPRSLDGWTTLRVWVEAPQQVRLARGLARDGDHLADHWQRWQGAEAAEFAREETRARADVRVDGAARSPEEKFALLPEPGSAMDLARTTDARNGDAAPWVG